MFLKIVKNNFSQKKIITFSVLIFITLSVILGSSAAMVIVNLSNSITKLEEKSVPAHFVQMHTGEYEQEKIDEFVLKNKEKIKQQLTMTLVNIDGSMITYNDEKDSFAGTVQDISFVKQNEKFDYLLDQQNEKLQVKNGDIAVPIYFMEEYGLHKGEKLKLNCDQFTKTYIISDGVRDFEMNSSMITSKRFVLSDEDYKELIDKNVGEKEYLIEFKLYNSNDSSIIKQAYQDANLFKIGPTVEYTEFITLNLIADGIVIVIIIFISILLILIAMLCIRFTLIASMEEDYREIGVMKAIGICLKNIKKIYLFKYKVLTVIAGIIGYVISFFTVELFTINMKKYMASDATSFMQYISAIGTIIVIYFIIVLFCKLILKRFDKISTVEAIRSNNIEDKKIKKNKMPLYKNKIWELNIFMGIRDVVRKCRIYKILLIIFIISTFVIIVPINIYNTVNSPKFISYMGIGQCDLRMDFGKTDDINDTYEKLNNKILKDKDVKKHAEYATVTYKVKSEEGAWDNLNVEIGDFSIFPIEYLKGEAPDNDDEIALSFSNAGESALNKKVGDVLTMFIDGEEKHINVSGIYQDITNGGKTAKAKFDINNYSVLRYVVYMDFSDNVDIDKKKIEYGKEFNVAKITDMEEHVSQTLGNIVGQLKFIVATAILLAVIVSVLITMLFVKMLLAKDSSQIGIMRSLGVMKKEIQIQYITRIITVLFFGVIIGTIAANLLGEVFVSALMSMLGVSKINFVIDITQAYILCPLILCITVTITTIMSSKTTIKTSLLNCMRS